MFVYYRGTDRTDEINALHNDEEMETPTGVVWLTDGAEPASRYGNNLIRITMNRKIPEQYFGIAEHELGNHREWAIPVEEWNSKFVYMVEETESVGMDETGYRCIAERIST